MNCNNLWVKGEECDTSLSAGKNSGVGPYGAEVI